MLGGLREEVQKMNCLPKKKKLFFLKGNEKDSFERVYTKVHYQGTPLLSMKRDIIPWHISG